MTGAVSIGAGGLPASEVVAVARDGAAVVLGDEAARGDGAERGGRGRAGRVR